MIKIGLDVHARLYVAVAQYDQLLAQGGAAVAPSEFVPWVEALLGQGHSVHVVYEACGFGFTLYRQLIAAGAHCYVIAPRKLDEAVHPGKDRSARCHHAVPAAVALPGRQHARTGGDPGAERGGRTGAACLAAAEQLVHHRQKLEAQGRSLLISHALPAPAHWWKEQTWTRLGKHLPEWITTRLQVARPALLSLQEQINALTSELEAAAPSPSRAELGKLTSVVLTREICDWHRFNNRRAISSYTGLCPGERSSGSKRVPGSVTKRGNPAGARGLGGVRLAHGALPAAISAGAKTSRHAGQRLARHRRAAQKGDRGRGAPPRR